MLSGAPPGFLTPARVGPPAGKPAARAGPPSAQDITIYKLAKNPIPPKAATKPNPQRRLPQRTLPNAGCPSGRYPTNIHPRSLLQLNKCSPSASSPNKRSPSISYPTKQAFMLNLFSNQTNVRPRPLPQLSKIRGQGQEGVGNLGGASDWASRGEVLCVIRGAPWVSDRRPRRAPGRVGPPSAQDPPPGRPPGWEAPRPPAIKQKLKN